MQITIQKCDYEKIKIKLVKQIRSFNSTIDSFLEEHILGSSHYEIVLDGEQQIGYCSIYKGGMLTQFSLDREYRQLGQEVFAQVKKLEYVQKAFVPTCDEFFLSHALDQFTRIEKQAYFFQDGQLPFVTGEVLADFICEQAQGSDLALIQEQSGEFFDRLEEQIEAGEIYIGKVQDEPVAFGIIEKSRLYDLTVASVGMFTRPELRGQGYGSKMIQALKAECYQQGIQPIAGCWYYNHTSKKTLERAGMYSPTRLLVIYL